MAMSQRTPSHWPAILRSSSPIIASCDGGVGVVELQRVGPAGEIGIAAVGEQQVAGRSIDPGVILRSAGQVEFGAVDEILGMLLDPGMIEAHVIGDEIEHQLQAALLQSFAEAGQGGVAAEVLVDRVAGDREAGAGDVFLAQVRQRLLEFVPPLGIARARLVAPPAPVCQTLRSQIQSKPCAARRSSSASGMSSSVAGRPSVRRQLRQPDAGVDLVQSGRSNGHVSLLRAKTSTDHLAATWAAASA